MKIEIPKKIWYIKRGAERLAYVTAYDATAATRKKQETGRKWAGEFSYVIDPETNRYKTDENGRLIQVPKNNPEEIIDNTLCAGWKIIDDIQRGGRWSHRNVVWRVLSPHGFEFEITTSNMFDIMQSCTITNGEIMDKCTLGYGNILLPESSEPYKLSKEYTELKENKSGKPSELKVGNIVLMGKGEKYKYLGRYYALNQVKSKSGNDRFIDLQFSKDKYYFFKGLDGYEKDFIKGQKSPKILKIESTETEDIDYSVEISQKASIHSTNYDIRFIMASDHNKIEDVEFILEGIDKDEVNANDTKENKPIIINGAYYYPHAYKWDRKNTEATPTCSCYNFAIDKTRLIFADSVETKKYNVWSNYEYEVSKHKLIEKDKIFSTEGLIISNGKIRIRPSYFLYIS